MPLPTVIAIDGPVASGKTVVGELLSDKLGYRFFDTGSMYRAFTWAAIEREVGLEDEEGLFRLAQNVCIGVSYDSGEHVTVGGRDVTHQLRRPDVEEGVSLVARVPAVRQALVRRQREIAGEEKIVMVGRDIGTVVLPQAQLKIFLSASPEERSRRRHKQLLEMGKRVQYPQVLKDLKSRDELDSSRAHSPLYPAKDAHLVDAEVLGVEEVVQRIMSKCGMGKGHSV